MRVPPALAAEATPRIIELLGDPPARILEVGFGGIHAEPLRMVGFEVTVVARDDAERGRALARAGDPVYDEVPPHCYRAVLAPVGADLTGIRAESVLIVEADGTVRLG